MAFIGIRRRRALLPIIGGNVIATPIGAPRRALFVALLQRPNAFSVVCRRANARKVRLEVITSDAFANEVVVVLARFVTPHAFFGRVGTNASPTIRDRNFAIDARELAVVVAMLHKRFMRARIAHRHFARLRRFCIDAPPIADAHFGLCAMASHAFVLDTRLGGIGARARLRALSRNGRLACPLVANPIVWARARHRTRRFGHAFILVTTIPLATIDIAMTNDLFARHALRILAKQPIGTRVDRRAFARKTSAIFSTNRSRGARSLRASIFGAEYTSPIDTRPIILLAREIVVAFGLAFSRYANFPTRARFCRRTFIDAFAIFANLSIRARMERFAKMANASMNVRRQNRARVGKFAYRENASPNATTISLASRMIGRVSMGDVYSAPKMLARRDRAPRERFVEKMALVLRANARRSTRVPMGCFAKMRSA